MYLSYLFVYFLLAWKWECRALPASLLWTQDVAFYLKKWKFVFLSVFWDFRLLTQRLSYDSFTLPLVGVLVGYFLSFFQTSSPCHSSGGREGSNGHALPDLPFLHFSLSSSQVAIMTPCGSRNQPVCVSWTLWGCPVRLKVVLSGLFSCCYS